MVIRNFRRFGATRVDHYQRAVRVGRNVAEDRTGALKAMGLPRVLADEYRDLRLLVASAESRPKKHMVDPELTGLFLGQRVGAEDRAERAPRRCSIAAAQMIALPDAAEIENARAAISIAPLNQALGDLADDDVPTDFLEAAV